MSSSPQRSLQSDQGRLPSIKEVVGGPWNTNLHLPPIRWSEALPAGELRRESERIEDTQDSTRTNDLPNSGYWPPELPPQTGPMIVDFEDSDKEEEQEEEEEEEDDESREDSEEDDESRQPLSTTRQSQPNTQSNLLTVSDSRPILRLSPKALAEGGPELEAQQYTLLHQYRLRSSSSTDEPTSAPPAYVYQTPTAPQPSSGPVPFSFNVLRAQQGDLVNVRTPSVRAQGILRPTAILEDEDESHKRYKCDWPNCGKKYDRPSSLEVHKHSHTRTQPFPCPESGCSRAFSVKSNMLRHFRSHPKRAGMSAAEVSAASAKKAASITAAKEKASGGTSAKSPKDNEKEKEKEKENENDKGKEIDKAGPNTSVSTSNAKPPILTITPAPSTLSTSKSKTYPATRARKAALASALAAAISSCTSASEGDATPAAEDSSAVTLSVSVSPSPSPLLSPHSPQSTYSSAPTSSSTGGLLSPSFAATSTSGSIAFSPPSSELLSPHSICSPNSSYSIQSPHSPAVSTTSEKEQEKDDRHASGSSDHSALDHEREGSLSKSPVPTAVTVSTTTPDQTTTSPTTLASSPPPQRLLSSPTPARSPSPFSPQFRSYTLYPVSDTRSSVMPLGDKRSANGNESTEKDSGQDYRPRGSHERLVKRLRLEPSTEKDTAIDQSRRVETLQSKSSTAKEKVTDQGYWPAAPNQTRDIHPTLVETLQSESSMLRKPSSPPRSISPRVMFVRKPPSPSILETGSVSLSPCHSDKRKRSHSDIGVETEEEASAQGYWPAPPKPTKILHETLVEALRSTEPNLPLRSASPHAILSGRTCPSPALVTGSPPRSPPHADKRKRTDGDTNNDNTENASNASVQGYWPSAPASQSGKDFQKEFVEKLQPELRRTAKSISPRSTSPRATSPCLNTRHSCPAGPQLRSTSPSRDEEELQEGQGFFPKTPPPQDRAFHRDAPLFSEQTEEEADPCGAQSQDEMDVENTGSKKDDLSHLGRAVGGVASLKSGFAREIEKQKGYEKHGDTSDLGLNKSTREEQAKRAYMDVDSSEAASLSEPPDNSLPGFRIRAGLGELVD